MAELVPEGDTLVVRLSTLEKAEALHGDVTVPRAAVVSVEVVDDALHWAHGYRVGTAVPGWMIVGTVRNGGLRTFVAVHHDAPRGVRVVLHDCHYDELIIGAEDPERVAAAIAW